MPPPSQQERREATRAALMSEARRLFGTRGFADVPADEVVAAAGVTRGALHYHFGDKRGLFRAIFEELETEIAAELTILLEGGNEDLLMRALSAFLDICERPEVSRIALTDAPGVLGWKTWREIEGQHGLGLLAILLSVRRDNDADGQAHLRAQLVFGAVIEAALFVANSEDMKAARTQAEMSLVEVFAGLLE